jgi:hypothetical protein
MEEVSLRQTFWIEGPPRKGYAVSPSTGLVEQGVMKGVLWRLNSRGTLDISIGPISCRGLRRRSNGRSTFDVLCPWCGSWVTVYPWSFSGCGKRCGCKALIGHHSAVRSWRIRPKVGQTIEQWISEVLSGAEP